MYYRGKATPQLCKVIKCCALHFQWSKDHWKVGSSNSGLHKINHFDYYLHHFIEHRRKLFGSQSFPVNDAVFDVDVRKFSWKDTSKSDGASWMQHSMTRPQSNWFSVKKVSTALITSCPVVVECNVKQQRSSSTMRHPHGNLPYTNNCTSDVISVDSFLQRATPVMASPSVFWKTSP